MEAATAQMDSCSKSLLKSVNVNFLLQLQKDAEELGALPQLLTEQAFKHERFQIFAARKEVTYWN